MPDTKEFKRLVNSHFAPFIREMGFKGSGFSYRKITENHYIYSLTIQANKYGGSCCMEMGVHIDFIPNVLQEIVCPSRVTPYDCEFRKRLSPKGLDYWWEFGKNEESSLKSIKHMIETFKTVGKHFFKQFEEFPKPLDGITIKDIVNKTPKLDDLGAPLDLRMALTLARVNKFIGRTDEATKLGDWGLSNINGGTALIPIFEDIKREIECNE